MYLAEKDLHRLMKERNFVVQAKRICSFEEACRLIRKHVADDKNQLSTQQVKEVTRGANLLNPLAKKRLTRMIKEAITELAIQTPGFSLDELAYGIFAKNYGLNVLQEAYDNPDVEEVYSTRWDNNWVIIDNKRKKLSSVFHNEKSSLEILQRLSRRSKEGVASESNPVNSTNLADGTRLAWRIPNASKYVAYNLRKHANNLKIRESYYVEKGVCSEEVLDVIKALGIANASMGIIGEGAVGKTTFLKLVLYIVAKETKRKINVLERKRELNLYKFFLDMGLEEFSVEEMEETKESSLAANFENAMQASAQLLVQGEILTPEEVLNLMKLFRRGHSAGFFTAHAYPEYLIDAFADLYTEQYGQNREAVKRSLAQCIEGSIYMKPTERYARKILTLSEYYVENDKVIARPFVEYDEFNDRFHFQQITSKRLLTKLDRLSMMQGQAPVLYKKLQKYGVISS